MRNVKTSEMKWKLQIIFQHKSGQMRDDGDTWNCMSQMDLYMNFLLSHFIKLKFNLLWNIFFSNF